MWKVIGKGMILPSYTHHHCAVDRFFGLKNKSIVAFEFQTYIYLLFVTATGEYT